jgi:peptide/nickel transport system permease protein
MARFIVRRLVGMVFVLFAISVLVFLIFNVIPNSDPGARIAGKNANPELIARVNEDFGLIGGPNSDLDPNSGGAQNTD